MKRNKRRKGERQDEHDDVEDQKNTNTRTHKHTGRQNHVIMHNKLPKKNDGWLFFSKQ